MRLGEAVHLLLANLSPREQRVTIGPLLERDVAMRRLNAETAPRAMTAPERFRAGREMAAAVMGELALTLEPFEIVRIDGTRR